MRYTKEFKLECVMKYLNGEHIEDPGGCVHHTFHNNVLDWVRIYKQLGEVGLEHKKSALTYKDKLEICRRVEDGESFTSIAISYGRHANFISKIYKKYLSEGLDGLKSDKRGRPSKMKKDKKELKLEDIKDPHEREKFLLKEIEKLQIENEYLKKLDALVQKRMDQQQKKK